MDTFTANSTFVKISWKSASGGKGTFSLIAEMCGIISSLLSRAVANLYAFKAMRFAIFQSSSVAEYIFFLKLFRVDLGALLDFFGTKQRPQ